MARITKGRLFTRKSKKHGNVYWFDYSVNGKRFRVKLIDQETGAPITGKSKAEKEADRIVRPYLAKQETERRRLAADALRSAEEVAEEAEKQAEPKLLLSDAWKEYVTSTKRPDSSEATLRQYGFQWNRFCRWTEEQGLKFVVDVTPETGELYSRILSSSDLSNNTYNKHIRLLRLVFETLNTHTVNPFDGIGSKAEEQESRQELAWDTLCKVCDQAEGEMKTMLFLGLYTGQRLKDCVLLQWENVDLMRNWILMKPAKTRRRKSAKILHIPILPDLRSMLEATPPEKRSGYVLPNLAEHYLKSRDRVTSRVQKLFIDCGIQIYKPGTGKYTDENGTIIDTGKRAVIQYGFHSLRHTTVSLLQQAGVAQSVVQAIVGHNSVAMTKRYTHIGRDAIQSAMKALPSVNGNGNNQTEELRSRVTALLQTAPAEKLQKIILLLEND